MSWSYSLGHLFGSELRVHATFFLLLAWIGTAAWLSGGPADAVVNIAFVLALFACVVAHEFGHALMARRFGIRTPDITLLPIGGMARLERIPEKPSQEIAVALAGPAVNVVIWAFLTILLGVETNLAALGEIEEPGSGFFARLAAVNLFLVVFNMIPAFPMDGGRVLRATLAISLGRVRATRYAALAGQGIAFLFGFLGLTTGNPLLILIAIFVFMAAIAESSDVELHDLARGYVARDVMITSYEALPPSASLQSAATALLRTTQAEFPVITPDGTLAGFLTKAEISSRALADQMSMSVSAAMITDIPSVALQAPMEDVLDALQHAHVPAVAVTDKAGNFLGYVTRENVGEWAILYKRK
ncbi:site-2 protease family protein [Marivita hallyeonensis]|uniref:Zinc metalloprotease n=1 Tax=Marivita hallyeonensis TaxID=996342 RepID=A0A1M5TBE5_9RHOB|nr:site-2 protease family protein [Marivita hallyeonensis]SHH47663.1 stage IV sporulation protein FB [Marivita hallyeonensis]